MTNRLVNFLAGFLLLFVFLVTFFSIKDDCFTFDETAHIGAGFSYLTQRDYRLNPEHPPLIKDLAALPLLFLKLNFPKNHPSWIQESPPYWWLQFDFANQFLYYSGNNPDKILLWSRLPMILVLIFLGWFLFYFSKKLFDWRVALLSLLFFSFSPTFLAHGRLITTDVGAALGVVLATFFWLKFLKEPIIKNIFFTGLIFGIVMLLKFSLITLIPFFGLITISYAWLLSKEKIWMSILKYVGKAIIIGTIGLVFVIWPIYFFHISNFPHKQQIRDTEFLMRTSSIPKFLQDFDIFLAKNSILRPIGHFLLGILLAINRSATGNTTFFLGEISTKGWKIYFPFVYLIKEPLAFHILTIIVVLFFVLKIKEPIWKRPIERMKDFIRCHFVEFSMILWFFIYWGTSLNSSLNIGVRHLLPVFPFTMILVARGVVFWLENTKYRKLALTVLMFLICWQITSVLKVFPHFLAYANELVGGPDKLYLYTVDSNLDWGQDLKRLKKWMEKNKIEKIYLDYFGGGNPRYYLGEKYESWWGQRNPKELPKGSYLAISATVLQGGRALPSKNYDQDWGYYLWLNSYQPITKIGYSIFVFYIP